MDSVTLAQFNQRLQALGFDNMNVTLGKGNFGQVGLYRYLGSDPQIQKLCDSRDLLAVKLSETPDQNEAAIADYLEQHPSTNRAAFNQTKALKDGDGLLGIATQYEYYKMQKLPNGKYYPLSKDLEGFTRDMVNPGSANNIPYQQNPGISLSQLSSGMQQSQASLHDRRVLSNDTAGRNFLMNAEYNAKGDLIALTPKIADYGLSQAVPEGQDTVPLSGNNQPLATIDYGTIQSRQNSAYRDLYALKAAMIGTTGIACGAGSSEARVLNPNRNDAVEHYFKSRVQYQHDHSNLSPQQNDEYFLRKYLENASAKVKAMPESLQKQELTLYINSYSGYMTSMPPAGLSFEQACAADDRAMNRANEAFVRGCLNLYQDKLSKPTNAEREQLLLTIQRLEKIPIESKTLKQQLMAEERKLSHPDNSWKMELNDIKSEVATTSVDYRQNISANSPTAPPRSDLPKTPVIPDRQDIPLNDHSTASFETFEPRESFNASKASEGMKLIEEDGFETGIEAGAEDIKDAVSGVVEEKVTDIAPGALEAGQSVPVDVAGSEAVALPEEITAVAGVNHETEAIAFSDDVADFRNRSSAQLE